MAHSVLLFCRIRWGLSLFSRIRWGFHASSSVLLVAVVALTTQLPATTELSSSAADASKSGVVSPSLAKLAANDPDRSVEAIVQLHRQIDPASVREAVNAAGGRVTGELDVINGLAVRISAGEVQRLADDARVRAVSLNARVKQNAIDPSLLATSFNQSIRSADVWNRPLTGKGVGVAVIDTGIAGDLADFRTSQTDSKSRVIASAVINPNAKTAKDTYGHGTHVAGIIAGNGTYRSDSLRNKYVGVAPDANLVSVKVSDDQGEATVLDAIYGLQFAVDHKDAFNIRVVNLSLESTVAESYRTDPLDAAAEAAWFKGIVVVAAAGNRGSASDAVSYAPGNDPYVISAGAVDDMGTKKVTDDTLADWSSRGVTQDGFSKPEVIAPGAHIVSTLAPKSAFTTLCKSCIVSGQYFRVGGTSMSAPMVAGAAALLLQANPGLTPNQVKGALTSSTRNVLNAGQEIQVPAAVSKGGAVTANKALIPSTLVNAVTGEIDYTRSRWSRSRWSTASGALSATWAKSSYTCDCSLTETGAIDPTRSRWSRSRWSTSFVK
jgi:serine protease AprX